MSPRFFVALSCFVSTALLAGCKGDTVVKDNPKTLDELARLKANSDEQGKLIKDLEAEKARCMGLGSGAPPAPGEISVVIENDILTVRPPKPGEPPHPVDDKTIGLAVTQFVNLVAKSKGSIQKCYEQALRKDTSLQARSVRLMVSASFQPNGTYKSASFSPSLGETFDACMKTIAAKWVLPAGVPTMPFRAPVSLTPS